MQRLKSISLVIITLLSNASVFSQSRDTTDIIKVLIVDGQNNHDQWPKITYILKKEMEKSGLFHVDVERSAYTWKGDDFLEEFAIAGIRGTQALDKPKSDPNFTPNFAGYDVVINNFGWNAAPWPEQTQKALEEYIKGGGGLVVFHAADNAFPQWEAYNQMIGLGGWGDRTEKDGPYVYYNDAGEIVRDTTAGKAGAHGPESEYQIRVRDGGHPITMGMPSTWMHTKDELYNRLRGPAENMKILATAYSDPDNEGTGRHEPALMVLTYGDGRIFHNIMGHADYSVLGVGFMTSMLRGAEWAATGEVTQDIPEDFPTAETSSSREFGE
ncbi:MAG TPA: ThuA domain-containing protein [Pricia sp.]|nr:ThuA domain-containing protein [Pricia sp.]